jgi:hypothetical protein
VQNALRYFPPNLHRVLAAEFLSELQDYGHIYMYRFVPQFEIRWVNAAFVQVRGWDESFIVRLLL